MGDVLWVFSYHMISVSARPFHEVGKVEFVGGEQPRDLRPRLAGGLLGDVARVGRPPCIEGVGRAYQNISSPWFISKFVGHQGGGFYAGMSGVFGSNVRGYCLAWAPTLPGLKVTLRRHRNGEVVGDVDPDQVRSAWPRRHADQPALLQLRQAPPHLPLGAVGDFREVRHRGVGLADRRDVRDGQKDVLVGGILDGLPPRPDEGLKAHSAAPQALSNRLARGEDRRR